MTTTEVLTHAQQIRRLGTERADEPVYTHLALDGTERVVTGAELSRRALQLAGALAERGVTVGDRISLALRNSPEFAMGAFAAWLLGAIPIPVRWDVPEWEFTRLRE